MCCYNNCRGVADIRKSVPVNINVHYPKTEADIAELARRVAEVHADAVNYKLKQINCPTSQKLELLDAVIETVKIRNREQT